MKPDQEWMTKVPTTNEECMQALERENALMQAGMQGLFTCLISQGKTTMEAYEETLLAAIGQSKSKIKLKK